MSWLWLLTFVALVADVAFVALVAILLVSVQDIQWPIGVKLTISHLPSLPRGHPQGVPLLYTSRPGRPIDMSEFMHNWPILISCCFLAFFSLSNGRLDHTVSTSNKQQLAGKPAGLFRCKEHNDISDIFRLSNTSKWDLFVKLLL